MARTLLIAAALLLMPSLAAAQDLNGTWVRDPAASDVTPDSMYWTVRGVVTGGTRGATSTHTITIARDATTMRITDPARPLRVYTLDGQAREVPADTGRVMATIRATPQGDAVVVDRSQNYSGLPGSATLVTHEYWTLAPDRNSLTLTTIRETPARSVTYNEVYKRQ